MYSDGLRFRSVGVSSRPWHTLTHQTVLDAFQGHIGAFSSEFPSKLVYGLLSLALAIVERDGGLLPDYAAWRFDPQSPSDVLRKGHAPERIAFSKDSLRCRYSLAIVNSGYEERVAILLENGEMIFISPSGSVDIRCSARRGIENFQDFCFIGGYFWKRVNRYLDRPFVESQLSQFPAIRFMKHRFIRSEHVEQALSELCGRLLGRMLPKVPEASIRITCATRQSRATAQLIFPDYLANYLSGMCGEDERALVGEVAGRIASSFEPFSEAFRSPNVVRGAWASADEAALVGRSVDYMTAREGQRTAVERAAGIGELREGLERWGVPCHDLFERIAIS